MDNDFDAGNDFDHGNNEEFNGRNEDNFDNGNEDEDKCTPSTNTPSQTCALTLKIPSQKSHPSSQTKHINDEDDWMGQGIVRDDSVFASAFQGYYLFYNLQHYPSYTSIVHSITLQWNPQ